MNELQRPLEVIETEINFYKNQTATGIIEIGKRLIEAKAQLPHGEWGEWLKKRVDFSQDTARNFMRVAESFPNSETIRNLSISKVYALLEVPQEERQGFIAANPIDEMTTRQLQEVIKAKKQADLRIEDLEQKLQNKPKEIEVTKEIIKEIEVAPADYRATKTELEKLKTDLEMAEFKNQQLKRRMDEDNTPVLFQRMAKSESEAQLRIIELNKKIDRLEADSKTIEHKVKKSSITFCGKVHNFLTDVGGLAWINDYADLLDGQERKDYLTALNALEGWLYTIKNNIEGE